MHHPQTSPSWPAAPRPPGRSEPVRILIVADDWLTRYLLSLLLEHPETAIATTGHNGDALRIATEQHPHAVLLDTYRHGARSTELCRQLRCSRPETPPGLLVFVDDHTLEPALVAASVDAVVRKPCSVTEVLRTLGQVLRPLGNVPTLPLTWVL